MAVATVQAQIVGEVTEYGYYEKAAEFERQRNLSATSGYVQTGNDVVLVQQTNNIPMKKGRLFGFKFKLAGFENVQVVQLNLVVTHPKIVRQNNGSVSTGYSYVVTLQPVNGVVENHSGYILDNDYEMVAGEWRFEFWYKEKLVLSKVFTTYPENVPPSGMVAREKPAPNSVAPGNAGGAVANNQSDSTNLPAGDSSESPQAKTTGEGELKTPAGASAP